MTSPFGGAKDKRKQQEEERKRQRESDHNSNVRNPKRPKPNSDCTPESHVSNNPEGEGGGGGSSTNQSKTDSRLKHLNKASCSLSVIRNLITELDGVEHTKSKMVEGVIELIKMDLNMEEGIGKAIEVLDNSVKCCHLEDFKKMVRDTVSQAQRAQRATKKAKKAQNKLRSALVDLLFSGLE
ncbi:hypothetical protein LguiA_012524 [Lonicera macranthoides]